MMCTFEGESLKCSDVFSLKNGIITGIADAVQTGDASVGGFPYYCTMTGTLGCMQKKLVDGWIQCTYCIGPLADGGLSCALLDGVAGTTGVGGHFAGPLTADYFYDGDGGGAPPAFGTQPPPMGNDPGIVERRRVARRILGHRPAARRRHALGLPVRRGLRPDRRDERLRRQRLVERDVPASVRASTRGEAGTPRLPRCRVAVAAHGSNGDQRTKKLAPSRIWRAFVKADSFEYQVAGFVGLFT